MSYLSGDWMIDLVVSDFSQHVSMEVVGCGVCILKIVFFCKQSICVVDKSIAVSISHMLTLSSALI